MGDNEGGATGAEPQMSNAAEDVENPAIAAEEVREIEVRQ